MKAHLFGTMKAHLIFWHTQDPDEKRDDPRYLGTPEAIKIQAEGMELLKALLVNAHLNEDQFNHHWAVNVNISPGMLH